MLGKRLNESTEVFARGTRVGEAFEADALIQRCQMLSYTIETEAMRSRSGLRPRRTSAIGMDLVVRPGKSLRK